MKGFYGIGSKVPKKDIVNRRDQTFLKIGCVSNRFNEIQALLNITSFRAVR